MSTVSAQRTPRPMLPANALLMARNRGLADKDFRESVRQMHNEGYPLVKMVEALGLDDDMTERTRQILDELAPDVVEGIRRATLEMLDSGDYEMPLDYLETMHARPAPTG